VTNGGSDVYVNGLPSTLGSPVIIQICASSGEAAYALTLDPAAETQATSHHHHSKAQQGSG
jgi:hypothetical protein